MEVVINLVLALIANCGLTISIFPVLIVYATGNSLKSCQATVETFQNFYPQMDQACELARGLISLYVLIMVFGLMLQLVGWLIFVFITKASETSPMKSISAHIYHHILLRTFIALNAALLLMFISLLAVYSTLPAPRAIGISGFLLNLTTMSATIYHCYTESKKPQMTAANESTLTLDTNQNTNA